MEKIRIYKEKHENAKNNFKNTSPGARQRPGAAAEGGALLFFDFFICVFMFFYAFSYFLLMLVPSISHMCEISCKNSDKCEVVLAGFES